MPVARIAQFGNLSQVVTEKTHSVVPLIHRVLLLFLKALKFEIFEVDIFIKPIIIALAFAWFDDPFPVASVVLTNCVPQITLVLSANVIAVLIPAGARTINLVPLIALHEEAVPVTISA